MIKNKILLVFVSFWISLAYGQTRKPASELLTQAEQLQKTDGPQKAIDFLWKNSEKLERPEFLFMALNLIKMKNFKDILKVSELVLAKNPKDAEFLTFQGKAYLESSKDRKILEKAQESLRGAIEANPKFEPPYLILDGLYEQQDNLSRAQKKPAKSLQSRRNLFEDLIKNIGEKPLYLAKLCEIDTLDGVNEDALKNCKKAVEMDKNNIKNQLFLAQVYRQRGEKPETLQIFQTALKMSPKSEDVLNAYGTYLEGEKNYTEAYTHFKTCAEANPKSDVCVRGLGASAASLKKWEECFSSFQKLCKKDRKWSQDVRKASMTAKELGEAGWEQKLLELSINCNI